MSEFRYVGSELEIFAHATNWKRYIRHSIAQYLIGDVLEVGAGIGATTRIMNDGSQRRWVCLETDRNLAETIRPNLSDNLSNCEIVVGKLGDLREEETFNAIFYMDVLEHIEDDRGELDRAARRLKPNGVLIVVGPALPWLYSPFDVSIGHYRRYTKSSLRAIRPKGLVEETVSYLDSVGLLASAANRLLLQSSSPTLTQIKFWDRVLIPFSRIFDSLCLHSFGKSVFAVWRSPAGVREGRAE